ncbi:MAG: SMC-Scp complex subunit ScpB [Bifidobacterium thermophilum]|nr:SMC-Scp complex subunit ScpB [Bifidobacterium thermophilum]
MIEDDTKREMASQSGTVAPGGLDKLQQAWQVDDFPGGLPACLEAVLMVADGPQQERDLARALHCDPKDVRDALESLQREYDGDLEHGIAPRGFALRSSARGWQYVSRSEFEPVVGAFVTDGQTSRLSQAALEALAIIAYKQPMTRAQVASIRGVNSDGVIRSLTVRGLVQEHGVDPQTHAALLETTGLFLEYMGLDSLDDLPSLAPFLPADAGQVVREAAGEQLGAL